MDTGERAIRELHTNFIEGVNAGDLAKLLTLITDDVVMLGPGQAPVGRKEFSVNLPLAHQQLVIRCVSELEDVVVAGDIAYTRARDTLSVTPRAGGENTRLSGHRLTVYRKQSDGRWLLARDAHTLSPQT